MTPQSELEQDSISVIRGAWKHLQRLGVLWSMGKDSTLLLWLCRLAFDGEVPFPVIHVDTGYKFPEMYTFRDTLAATWNLNLKIVKNERALADGMNPTLGRMKCCTALKTEPMYSAVGALSILGLLTGIRGDEHVVRGKERFYSPRKADGSWDPTRQPVEFHRAEIIPPRLAPDEHCRVHPLLNWTESDVWQYTSYHSIPVVPLYFSRNGYRYRSLGCVHCTAPEMSEASSANQIVSELALQQGYSERHGRSQDKERIGTMEKLRSLGYM